MSNPKLIHTVPGRSSWCLSQLPFLLTVSSFPKVYDFSASYARPFSLPVPGGMNTSLLPLMFQNSLLQYIYFLAPSFFWSPKLIPPLILSAFIAFGIPVLQRPLLSLPHFESLP